MTSSARASEQQVRPRYGRIAAFAGAVVSTLVTVSAGIGLLPSGGAPAQAAPDPGDGAASLVQGPGVAGAGLGEGERQGTSAVETVPVAAPAESGEGRRVVFDMSRQRVWLVDDDEDVRRSYLVSGSALDNLGPGTYEVFSRSRHATGIDGSSMDFMVRFTTGDNAAIGFHDIPEIDGEPVQSRDQLGTPLSHGCIRQARPDAVALWRFAPMGTTVVVTA